MNDKFKPNQQDNYLRQMEEIKRRIDAIEKLANTAISQNYLAVVTESIYLQFRKILELIAMASLVANEEAMKEAERSFRKLRGEWNAHKILKIVESVNPDFYPVPIEKQPYYDHPLVKSQIVEKTKGFLTRDMFSTLYNQKCGPLLHAENPFGNRTNYRDLWDEGSDWKRKIMDLLNSHKIKLVGYEGFYVINMVDATSGKAAYYRFHPKDPQEL